jgi:hypothetical protein
MKRERQGGKQKKQTAEDNNIREKEGNVDTSRRAMSPSRLLVETRAA